MTRKFSYTILKEKERVSQSIFKFHIISEAALYICHFKYTRSDTEMTESIE